MKGKKRSRQLIGGTGVIIEEVEVIKLASCTNGNNLYQFMHNFSCLPAPPRPNILIKFRLANTSKPAQTNSLLPLKASAWANLLTQYPGSLQIYLPIVLRFEVKLGYKGSETFILSENLASALEDPTIIEKKFGEI